MDDKQTVIYTARNKQQAHLLRNLLEETGIEAVVTGDVLSDGSGVDAVGWATAARVVVAPEDAAAARQFAEEFDRQGAGPIEPQQPAGIPPDLELPEWPTCPECGARRVAACPVCHTSGTDFPQADPQFLWTPEAGEGAAAASCGCGSGGCASGGAKQPEQEGAVEEDAAGEDEPQPPGLVLVCTTCDEPFRPEYPARCEWCGHEFPDGYPVDVQEDGQPPEEVPIRALVVMIILGLLAFGGIVYFLLLVPGS